MVTSGPYLNAPQKQAEKNDISTAFADLGLDGTVVHPDDDPEAINRVVQQAAYFSLFSIPNPSSPSAAIPLVPLTTALAIGFTVHEGLHRFEVREPKPNAACGFRVSKAISKDYVASVHLRMIPMPNNFEAAADRLPPPTILLPFLSQRFCALDGKLDFLDSQGSGFRAFGCGRTFPATVEGTSQIRLASVLDITEGFGQLAGVQGIGIVSGEIEPPSGFAFNTLFRIIDTAGNLQARTAVKPLIPIDDPTPDTVFMPFLSEPDPSRPLRVSPARNGKHVLIEIAEKLRLVQLNFDVGEREGIRSHTTTGPIIGTHKATLILDLTDSGPVIPAYSRNSEFSFFDGDRNSIGSLKADLSEARVFPTKLPGLRTPVMRIGGIAPTIEGTGQFKGPVGMVSVNGIFSLATGAVSTMYMIRLSDPLGRFQPLTQRRHEFIRPAVENRDGE